MAEQLKARPMIVENQTAFYVRSRRIPTVVQQIMSTCERTPQVPGVSGSVSPLLTTFLNYYFQKLPTDMLFDFAWVAFNFDFTRIEQPWSLWFPGVVRCATSILSLASIIFFFVQARRSSLLIIFFFYDIFQKATPRVQKHPTDGFEQISTLFSRLTDQSPYSYLFVVSL